MAQVRKSRKEIIESGKSQMCVRFLCAAKGGCVGSTSEMVVELADLLIVSHGAVDRLRATGRTDKSGVESADQASLDGPAGQRWSAVCRLIEAG